MEGEAAAPADHDDDEPTDDVVDLLYQLSERIEDAQLQLASDLDVKGFSALGAGAVVIGLVAAVGPLDGFALSFFIGAAASFVVGAYFGFRGIFPINLRVVQGTQDIYDKFLLLQARDLKWAVAYDRSLGATTNATALDKKAGHVMDAVAFIGLEAAFVIALVISRAI